MVGVVVVKSTEDDLFRVVFIVAVGVFQQNEATALGNVDAFGCDFESDRDMEIAGEGRLFVGFAVVVRVFEDDEFVGGFGVADTVVRVAGHGGNPEAAFVIEGELHWVGEVGEFFFRREELHFIAVGQSEFGLG